MTKGVTRESKMEAFELLESVVESIDIDRTTNSVLFTVRFSSQYVGRRQYLMRHCQDCCESVIIERVDGDPVKLVGRKITEVGVDIKKDSGRPSPNSSYVPESSTETVFRFVTDAETLVLSWFGESNGYYSEAVSIDEVKGKQ